MRMQPGMQTGQGQFNIQFRRRMKEVIKTVIMMEREREIWRYQLQDGRR